MQIQEGKEKIIIERICPEMEEIARENREYLRCLFKYILWFASNGVPMRAHDETDKSLNGKWVSFIRLQLKTNPLFRQLHEKFTRTRGIDYTSKTSVNDILVRLFILRSKMPACFQHLLMKVKDAAKREELALAVTYSCVNELINCIIQSSGGLMVICLGADGASVMAGE